MEHGRGAEAQPAPEASGMQLPSSTPPRNQPNETRDEQKASADEDAQLVEQAQAGSSRAFDRLVTKHRGRIYAMIYNMVKNDADAWDLSQEVFIKAWKALPRFESRARFSTWLFRISHNAVYDWLRKRRIQGDGELNDEVFDAAKIEPGAPTRPKQDQQPDQALEQSELRQRIEQALNQLSDQHREVVVLREVQGLDYKEIADITGSSLGTVMSRLYYARQKLQQHLKFES
ncbi:MAG: sigma-70 family RNA polymerase sigma factor [Akkermansiaceae bacterium]|nr:sigma-70 family RNA polymerase sigma factor [Akkermansiaceae bacterium]